MRPIFLLPIASLAATIGFALVGSFFLVIQIWASIVLYHSSPSQPTALIYLGWYAVIAAFALMFISLVTTYLLGNNAIQFIKQSISKLSLNLLPAGKVDLFNSFLQSSLGKDLPKKILLLALTIYEWRRTRRDLKIQEQIITPRTLKSDFDSLAKDGLTFIGAKLIGKFLGKIESKQKHSNFIVKEA